MRSKHILGGLIALCIMLMLAGCGGGGNSVSSSGTDIQTKTVGDGLTATMRSPALVDTILSTGLASFTAIYGGDISLLSYDSGSVFFNQAKIVFTSNRDGNNEIYMINTDGSNLIRLTKTLASDSYPSISANGQTIVFLTDRDGSPEIYSMNNTGGALWRLTNNAVNEEYPCVSSDGSKVVYSANVGGNKHLYVMSCNNSSASVQVTNVAFDDTMPVFSPDGTKIAFVSNRTGVNKIWICDYDGGHVTQLSTGATPDIFPTWAPDGTAVLFERDAGYSNREFYRHTVNVPGTDIQITSDGISKMQPWYSPDGQKIVYSAIANAPNYQLFLANANGTSATQIAFSTGNNVQPRISGGSTLRTYIGNSDRFGLSLGGVIVAQLGRSIAEVIGVDATTRTTISFNTLYLGDKSLLVGTAVSADLITYLALDNGALPAPSILVGTNGVYASVTSIDLFFDSNTGRLTSYLASERTKGITNTPDKVEVVGNQLFVHGSFMGAYNSGSKNNLAPSGAGTVVLDATTGKILSAK
jgi:Tol biopolymer transport system component